MCLKLIKAGELVISTTLKQYFLYAAKEIHISGNDLANEKKLKSLKSQIEAIILRDQKDKNIKVSKDIGRL